MRSGRSCSGRRPSAFRWGFKVPEQITVPHVAGASALRRAGRAGESHISRCGAFRAGVSCARWSRIAQQVGVLIFEFGTLRERSLRMRRISSKRSIRFLSRLPAGWRYAVEIRNAEFLTPDYFACLRAHDVAHVYNAWTRMPEIASRWRCRNRGRADLIVARALLRRGRPYEDAVRKFAPYDRVQEVNEPVRQGLRELIDMARVDGRPAFIFVNNRLEGNSPGTIVAITD